MKARRIGWVGTGVMGSSMCDHLVQAGHQVTVYNRTKEKAESLLAKGADWADEPAGVAREAEVVFTMVGFPEDVREVILGENGVLSSASPGSVIVDMTTSEPSLAVELYQIASETDVLSVDAPVSGGDVGARTGTLSIMVGGDQDAVSNVRPLLELMGETIIHQGGAGAGQHTKMVNQILIATTMIGVCEALLYGHRAGLDLHTVMESVSTGAAGSWSLSNYGPRILQGDFEPGFLVDHFVKDMSIGLGEAQAMSLSVPGLALAHQLYVALQAQGSGRRGTHALAQALATLSDADWP